MERGHGKKFHHGVGEENLDVELSNILSSSTLEERRAAVAASILLLFAITMGGPSACRVLHFFALHIT